MLENIQAAQLRSEAKSLNVRIVATANDLVSVAKHLQEIGVRLERIAHEQSALFAELSAARHVSNAIVREG